MSTEAGNNPQHSTPHKSSPVRNTLLLVIAVVVVVALVASGIIPRLRDKKALAAETTELAAPTVLVVQPQRGAPAQEIILPGNIQALLTRRSTPAPMVT